MVCQDRTRSVRLRSVFCQAGPASRVFKRSEAEQISANLTVRWDPDGIFAHHNTHTDDWVSFHRIGSRGYHSRFVLLAFLQIRPVSTMRLPVSHSDDLRAHAEVNVRPI
jgi:hypothetical protein